MVGFRTNFRDKQEWFHSTNGGIDLKTSSDEAAKCYDAAVSQLLGWYEDQSMGGLLGACDRMLKADPDFLLGQALALEVNLLGGLSAPRLSSELAEKLTSFEQLVDKKREQASEQELLHAQVIGHLARSELNLARQKLEQIVTLYPEDLTAVKLNQDTSFFLGQAGATRNAVANCLAKLDKSKRYNPLRGYVHGMLAFALEESNMYPQAQAQALKALEQIPRDTWAIHNYAHCLEMQGQPEEGLKWMLAKQADWSVCSSLASHQYWHTTLFHINNSNFDEAVQLLDQEVIPRCTSSGSSLDLHDSCSMIYRMQLVDLFSKTSKPEIETAGKQRWSSVYKICEPHKRDHLIGFNDAHYMMSYLGADQLDVARELINSIGQDGSGQFNEGQARVVKPLLEAMLEYKLGAYEKSADLLEPIRFDIVNIGGSHAQRDVFEQILLVSALKSSKTSHNQLAKRMLDERQYLHGRNLPQTELLATA